MTKKLRIRFVKFEHALVGQQIGVSGIEFFEKTEHIGFMGYGIDFAGDAAVGISLSPARLTKRISTKYFDSNAARNEYLNNVVNWITNEQFTSSGELKVGKKCEVRDYDTEDWKLRKLLAILPENCGDRYIFASELTCQGWASARYARPLASCVVQPTIDGDIYTWEMEVADEK